jgi:hypothetical protein
MFTCSFIQKVQLDNLNIGIKDFPTCFEEVLAAPDTFSVDDSAIAEDALTRFLQSWTKKSSDLCKTSVFSHFFLSTSVKCGATFKPDYAGFALDYVALCG